MTTTTTTLSLPPGVEAPSMEEAEEALGPAGSPIGSGMYRRVYRVGTSYWVYKYGNCKSNEYEIEHMTRARLELAAKFGYDWVSVPQAVLMEDHHYIAVQYIAGYHPELEWCDEYYPDNCSEYCKRHNLETSLNLEDMHFNNVIKGDDDIIYLIDLGGAWWNDDCCEGEGEEMDLVEFTWEDPWNEGL